MCKNDITINFSCKNWLNIHNTQLCSTALLYTTLTKISKQSEFWILSRYALSILGYLHLVRSSWSLVLEEPPDQAFPLLLYSLVHYYCIHSITGFIVVVMCLDWLILYHVAITCSHTWAGGLAFQVLFILLGSCLIIVVQAWLSSALLASYFVKALTPACRATELPTSCVSHSSHTGIG